MKNPDAAPLIAPAVTTATVASNGRSHASASTCGVARVMPTCPALITSVEVAAEDFPPGSPTSRYASPIWPRPVTKGPRSKTKGPCSQRWEAEQNVDS